MLPLVDPVSVLNSGALKLTPVGDKRIASFQQLTPWASAWGVFVVSCCDCIPNNSYATVDGMEFESLFADAFVTCLYDVAPVAVWRHAEPGEPVRYVLDVLDGEPVPEDVLTAALATVPEGETWELLTV